MMLYYNVILLKNKIYLIFNMWNILNLFNYQENIVNFYKNNSIDIDEFELRKYIILYYK